MSQYIIYVLLSKNGNIITTDHKLPFYYNKEVAKKDAELFKAKIKKVRMWRIKDLLFTAQDISLSPTKL